jgi:acyl-CoA thioester hydrolase
VTLHPHRDVVRPEWVDYNGHMNVAYYVLAFDHASDTFLDAVGLGAAWRERTNGSVFVVEAHVTYDREVHEGAPLLIHSRPLEVGSKTLRLFHRMEHGTEGFLAATNEVMFLHVDMTTRRSAPWPDDVRAHLESLAAGFDAPWPEQAGRAIGRR